MLGGVLNEDRKNHREGPTMTALLVAIYCGTCRDRHATVDAARECAARFVDEWSEYLTLSYAESWGAVPHRTLSTDDRRWDVTFANDWHQTHGEPGEPACDWSFSCTGPVVAVVDFQDHGDPSAACPAHAAEATEKGYRVDAVAA